ncbi:MAG: hypothetical protein KDI36_18965, partial [Pseudomonadales bacterium]|nr:hypothetical protein [Pseudomonadales bacterium]
SGFYGVWAYRTYPEARNDIKRSQTLDDIFLQLEEADQHIRKDVSRLPEDVRNVVLSALDRTEIGGGIWAQISGADRSRVMIDDSIQSNADQEATISWLVSRVASAQGDEAHRMSALIRDYGARQKLLRVIRQDIRMHGMQEIWLFFHVPVSFGLLAALTAHIVSVFIYW